jgi:hypothetical protein
LERLLRKPGARIVGALVAKMLRLANWVSYSLSVIAAVATMSLDLPGFLYEVFRSPSWSSPAYLLIGYGTGIRREWPDRD